MGFLKGGQKSTSTSSNQAHDYIKDAYGGSVTQGTNAMGMIGNLLGLGDAGAGSQAYQTFQDSTGFQSALDAGSKAITGNVASRGLLRSGSTGKALMAYGQDLAKQNFGQYLQSLLGLSGQGLQAGSLIGQTGQVSQSEQTSKKGLGGLLGGALSLIPGL